jgi:KamA family protein
MRSECVAVSTQRWEAELEKNIHTLDDLKGYLELLPEEAKQLRKVTKRHPMSISRYYLSLIDWNDPGDPIRKMAIPDVNELDIAGSYDTSGEHENTKMPGLQHKYAQTALILATNRCATYCRHCFRKRLVGLPNQEVIRRFEMATSYIRAHEEIDNVLITGGDPLILPTGVIERMLEMLTDIKHLNFIRFGSRVPVTFPARIVEDEEFLDILKVHSLNDRRCYVVTQFNHPREITSQSTEAVDRLIGSGVLVNNQAVLLRGVNDDPETMAKLQNKLIGIGINPYYIFQCRPVKRVKHHFQVPLYRGYEIIEGAKRKLNGHSKRFKYIMSHRTGKIEIVGIMDDEIYFKYHQAKNPKNIGKFFKRRLNSEAGWLDDL